MLILDSLIKQGVAHPPRWLNGSTTHMQAIAGSISYGCNQGYSDYDVVGFCIPPLDLIFPHLAGNIDGFGTQKKRFNQWQEHHISHSNGVEYDFTIYSIVKLFDLTMSGNPNLVDVLFTPTDCILQCTTVAQMYFDNRKLFLSNNVIPKFFGYARSQWHKITTKTPEGKRKALIEEFGYDVKYAAHLVRLLLELEDLITLGDMDLRKNSETLKAIRRGEWSLPYLQEWYETQTLLLEKRKATSVLPHKPNEAAIKQLLIDCIEHTYGDVSRAVSNQSKADVALVEIQTVLERFSA